MKLTERDILEALLDKTISINEAKLIMNESLSDVGDWMDDRLGDVAEIGSEVGRAIKRPFINAHNKKVYKHNNAARSAYADKMRGSVDPDMLADAEEWLDARGTNIGGADDMAIAMIEEGTTGYDDEDYDDLVVACRIAIQDQIGGSGDGGFFGIAPTKDFEGRSY